MTALSIRLSALFGLPGAGDDQQVVRRLVQCDPGLVDPVDEPDDLDLATVRQRPLDLGLATPRSRTTNVLIGSAIALTLCLPAATRGSRGSAGSWTPHLRPQDEPHPSVVGGVRELRRLLRGDPQDRARAAGVARGPRGHEHEHLRTRAASRPGPRLLSTPTAPSRRRRRRRSRRRRPARSGRASRRRARRSRAAGR